ncbi:hypothetical protein [Halodesulfurarchaeum sp.]|uniref:hypothetical protein n=1 Tax=Halodesulfurarchaeum sp. TaxID=1980530 RepID=UPI002FC30EDA
MSENIPLEQYADEQGGLLIATVNVSLRVEGPGNRYVDGIRVIDPPEGEGEKYDYHKLPNNKPVWDLLSNHRIELIEVHNWGLQVLGDCLGKAAIIENEFAPVEVKKTVIVNTGQPNEPAVEEVYEDYGVDWVVIES